MNFIDKASLLIVVLLLFYSCGEKSGPTLNFQFSSADPFNDNNFTLSKVLFKVVSEPDKNNKCPDVNKNGVCDIYVFPERCASSDRSVISSCGFSSQETFELKGVPLDFKYQVLVLFKDSNDKAGYVGKSDPFTNDYTQSQSQTEIDIKIIKCDAASETNPAECP